MQQVIFGAQGMALGTYKAFRTLFPGQKIECFLVTMMGNNAPVLAGLPVRELREFVSTLSPEEKADIQVWVCTPETVMGEIEQSLQDAGLCNYICLNSVKWAELQKKAFSKTGKIVPLAKYSAGKRKADISIYKIVHCKDKPLSRAYEEAGYIYGLQVGAALSRTRIALFADDVGNNISIKNGNYSELTGLYWIWKNILQNGGNDGAYYGLCHYRRLLDLSDDDLLRLLENDIDVVLPYPMPYEPDIEAHHLRYLSGTEWDAVLQALSELYPQLVPDFKRALRQDYLYNYNIILARKKVLDEYCEWLFPLLFRIEEINDPQGMKKPNRFIGYIGETLETFYFLNNKDRLKIVHTGCRFLV